MAEIFVALGSNLGERSANLRRGLQALSGIARLLRLSRCYETEPAHLANQPRYFNLVCQAETDMAPLAVLRRLKSAEIELGRRPSRRFGPRLIDLDLLLYDAVVHDSPELTLPHPRLHERAFVLVPLAEIAPSAVHPRLGESVAALLARLGDTSHLIWPAPDCDVQLPAGGPTEQGSRA